MERKKRACYYYPKLRGIRNEKGYTMQELANKLGITKNCYYKKENGITDFYLDEVRKILIIFDCKFEDIFFETVVNQKVNKNV